MFEIPEWKVSLIIFKANSLLNNEIKLDNFYITCTLQSTQNLELNTPSIPVREENEKRTNQFDNMDATSLE